VRPKTRQQHCRTRAIAVWAGAGGVGAEARDMALGAKNARNPGIVWRLGLVSVDHCSTKTVG
jgi:hypothetical protein